MYMFDAMSAASAHRCLLLADRESGLRAIIAIDDVTLGPAVGGIRTKAYESDHEALADAARLARAMTLKCAIAGLDAGGGKAVVISHPGMERGKAFKRLGRYIADLKGLYRCAGDLGTTEQDLLKVREETQFANVENAALADWCARGVLSCIAASASYRGKSNLSGLRMAVQGCGAMGAATARRLASEGAEVLVSDLDAGKAGSLAEEIGASVVAPESVLSSHVDILAPCAAGDTITEEAARNIKAWAICGAANNQLKTRAAGRILASRDIIFVPDFLSSAGAVVGGTANEIMDIEDPSSLIEDLGSTAFQVIEAAQREGVTTTEIAERLALQRIMRARGSAAIAPQKTRPDDDAGVRPVAARSGLVQD